MPARRDSEEEHWKRNFAELKGMHNFTGTRQHEFASRQSTQQAKNEMLGILYDRSLATMTVPAVLYPNATRVEKKRKRK